MIGRPAEAASMFYRFIFRNRTTGETREAIAAAPDSAARAAGLSVSGHDHTRGHSLRAPWSPWECWNAQGECVWHFNQTGRCVSGPRYSALISGLNDETPAASTSGQTILTTTNG
jgi:hypothetical protein